MNHMNGAPHTMSRRPVITQDDRDAYRRAREAGIRSALGLPHATPSEPPTADRVASWLATTLRILGRGQRPDPAAHEPVANLATLRRFERVEDHGVDIEPTDHGASFVLINHAGVRFRVTVERD
jgi:hypothetical protein